MMLMLMSMSMFMLLLMMVMTTMMTKCISSAAIQDFGVSMCIWKWGWFITTFRDLLLVNKFYIIIKIIKINKHRQCDRIPEI